MRVKGGHAPRRAKKRILKQARGYYGKRHSCWKTARQVVRRSKQPDMLLALLLATLVATVISFFCNGIDFSPAEMSFSLVQGLQALSIPAMPARDVWVAVAMGIFQVGAGFILMMLGARHVPAAQVGLLALVEPVLGPIWAWLAASEIPAETTFIGGTVILVAVGVDAAISAKCKSAR